MSDRPHPFDVLSRFVAQLSDLKANPDPDAKLVITQDVASRLGWELALALIHAGYRDDVATRYEEQEKRALDTLAQAGSKRERLQRAAKVLRLVNDDGDLVLTRGGHRRATVVGRYLWKIRVDKLTAAEAADVVQAEFGFPTRKAVRSFLGRADTEIREDADAEERRLPAILLDDDFAPTPWTRTPHIPSPPE